MYLVNCVDCGNEISQTARTCPYCGKQDAGAAAVAHDKAANELLWVVIILVTVVGIIGAAVHWVIGLVR